MGILGSILLVFLIIVAVLLVLIVIIQDEGGEGLGGIFAGSSSSTFGSRTGNVITRITSVLGGLFLVLALALAFVNRSKSTSGVEKAAVEESSVQDKGQWWVSPAPEASLDPALASDVAEGSLGVSGTPLPTPRPAE
jgi:preprotein translocase subunit SecG